MISSSFLLIKLHWDLIDQAKSFCHSVSLPESSQPAWWTKLSAQHLQSFTILYIKSGVEPKGNHMHWISDLWLTPKLDTYEYDCFLLTELWWIKLKSTKPTDNPKFLGQILWNCNNSLRNKRGYLHNLGRRECIFITVDSCHLSDVT